VSAYDFSPVLIGASISTAYRTSIAMNLSEPGVSTPDPGGNGGVGTVPDGPGNPNHSGNPNFPGGGGIGSPIPEPTMIPLLGLAIPLILRRRARRHNSAQ
jgi:hypothetical protein